MQEYKYEIHLDPAAELLTEHLNTMAAAGWELVSHAATAYESPDYGVHSGTHIVWRRPG